MSDLGNKEVFAKNLMYYLDIWGKEQKEVADAIGVPKATFNDWAKARKYPRIDKIELLSEYFGIKKSDLIERKNEDKVPSQMDTIASLLDAASPEQMEEVIRYIKFVLLNRK